MDEMTRTAELIELQAVEDFCAAADASLQRDLGITSERIGSALVALLPKAPSPVLNRVLSAGIEAPLAEAELEEILSRFAAAGVERYFFHLCPGAQPPELRDWLTRRGLEPHHRSWDKFVWAGGGLPAPLPGTRVDCVAAEHAPSFAHIVATAFGMPAMLEPLLAALVGRERWRSYLCFDGTTPFAAGALFIHEGAAWLGFGATLPSHRGRGGQTAILAQRVRDALALGCRAVTTETGEELPGEPQHSYHNIVRTGFRVHYRRENFTPRQPG